MLWLAQGASFFFLARGGEMFASKEGCWATGTYCVVGMGFSFGAVPNSIGQCGIRLIASRYGFGANKGANYGMER